MNTQGLSTWLRRRAERDPGRPAITFDERTITYAELQDKITRFADFLARCGVRGGDRVAYLGFNHPDFLVSLFATARLGAIFVPLNFRMAGDEVLFQLDDSGATVLISGSEHVGLVDEISARSRVRSRIVFGEGRDGWTSFDAGAEVVIETEEVDVDVDAPAAILYTSGTTGRPKGAILTHRNLWTNNVNWMLSVGYHGGHTALTSAPLFHSGGLCVMTLPVMMTGGHIVLHGSFDAGRVLEDVPKYRVTALFLVPTMMLFMTQHPEFGRTDLSSVQTVVAGAAPVPKHLLEIFSSRDIPVNQCWGLTEVATGATFLGTERALDKLGSCGTSGMLNEVKLIDFTGEVISEPSIPGELCVRGETVSPGYWNRPEVTAESRLEGGWLRTGDVAFRDVDGFYFICDRLKDMVITGGENVYPAEVESAIFTHEAVSDVAVIGASDDEWGERVVAVVVLKDGRDLDLESLREHLGGRLARYKLPRELRIVDELPRNTTGKILKHVLRENKTPSTA
ncbi:acyl-CoA synthetase [Gordonia aichiensis]|uniref:Putative acyl-CoA synthetase n=1 Tax=Gordonia aichiensis NBRC 108223 TaxID=1220583 RepID=L7KKE7_9ACTN|nr:long-chain fatty acid--CoA ligase [Gordonia aichiensis]GAC49360.1 putative acyl-CoA synthetase [Gordonia aichiensis NBRC 108223]